MRGYAPLLGFGATPRARAFLFFQAEDGIRGPRVTGVQTCALPIWAEAFAVRASFAMVAQTPHAILLPSADSLAMKVEGKDEADLNAGIRQIFVALVVALGLDARAAILRDGVPP